MKHRCPLVVFLLVLATRPSTCSGFIKSRSLWGRKRASRALANKNATLFNATVPAWQKELPAPLPTRRSLFRIHIPLSNSTHVKLYLLGTSHVSNDSSADVKTLLNHVEPNVVFLELCQQRIPLLEERPPEPQLVELQKNGTSFWERVRITQETSGLSKSAAIGTTLLTQVQDDYADSLGVELGGEFRVAWTYCRARRPVCILGDRPLLITLRRAWESLNWWGRTKCILGLIWSSFFKPKPEELRKWMKDVLEGDSDLLTQSMDELGESFPSLERVILKERDAYLAAKLYQTCRYLPRYRNHTMVAIVGAGHSRGICDWLTNGNGRMPEEILQDIVTTKKPTGIDVDSLIYGVAQLPYTMLTESPSNQEIDQTLAQS